MCGAAEVGSPQHSQGGLGFLRPSGFPCLGQAFVCPVGRRHGRGQQSQRARGDACCGTINIGIFLLLLSLYATVLLLFRIPEPVHDTGFSMLYCLSFSSRFAGPVLTRKTNEFIFGGKFDYSNLTNEPQKTYFGEIESNRIEFEKFIQLDVSCSHWADVPEAVRRLCGLCGRPRPRATNLEAQRVATGAIAAPTPIDHCKRTPAAAPQQKSWRSQAQFFNKVDHPNSTKTGR